MKTKITDITPLYALELVLANAENMNTQFLWYRSGKDTQREIANEQMEMPIREFNKYGFPEYIPIMFDILKYIMADMVDNYDPEDADKGEICINVLVDDNSDLAKNHTGDDFGFIRLFTVLMCYYHDKNSIKLEPKQISINGKLVMEHIELSVGKKYENKIEDNKDHLVENDTACCICTESNGNMVETKCGHKFHLNCLKCAPGMICPLCRADIKDFLAENGVSIVEIETRLAVEKNEKEMEQLCQAIDEIEINNLTDIDFLRLCMQTVKLNGGDIIAYNDIIFDMNANASELFAKISEIKSKKEKGVFVYCYDSPIEFILQMRDSYSKSNVEWISISEFADNTAIYDIVKNRTDRITNPAEEYVVVIMIENIINAHIVKKNACNGVFAKRRHQRDILTSMIKCIRCCCSGLTLSAQNREYAWAKNTYTKLSKRNKKRRPIKNNVIMNAKSKK